MQAVQKPERIKATYRSGSGDKGKSNLTKGSICTKDSPMSHFFNINWDLMVAIDEMVLADGEFSFLLHDEREVLKWVRRNLFSVSSYVYLAGDSKQHSLPTEFLTYMETYIEKAGKEIGGATDFIIWDTEIGVKIQNLIIPARKLDVATDALSNGGMINNSESTQLLKSMINRMSAWFFWMGRRIYKRLGIEEKYWQGYAEEFPILF